MRIPALVLLLTFAQSSLAVHESTAFGKIVGIESRPWGMHIQTNFAAGDKNGCPVNVGDTYMYDLRYDNSNFGESADEEVSMVLAAFAAQRDIAFHIYSCNSTRPEIGFIRLRK